MKRLIAWVLVLCMMICLSTLVIWGETVDKQSEPSAVQEETEEKEEESNNTQERSRNKKRKRGQTPEERIAALPGNAQEYSFEFIQPLTDSPLKDKEICILGSSVVFGANSQQNAVGEYLAARFEANLTKEAQSGTTLVDNGDTSYVQ